MRIIHITIGLSLLLTSCYKEVINIEPDTDRFNLQLTSEKQQFIYNSRDTSYVIEDPDLKLYLNDVLLDMKEIKVRGKSALRFQRKSYAVTLSEPLAVADREGTGIKTLTRFKLLALAMDYTYIENRIAFGLLEEAGVMPLFFKFVEFRINGYTQGVYLLMEDPEQYYKENGSEYILRRGYNHAIDDSDYEPSLFYKGPEEYENEFKLIYSSLTSMEGDALYRTINQRLNLNAYFRKMGIDYLLQNGDYTDELYLFASVEKDTIRFQPIPWDYDDIFANQPHEVGRAWGMGTLFGKRYYESMEAIYADVGHTLVFSIEDDLDYSIARDPVLYSHYLDELAVLCGILGNGVIDRVFEELSKELSTFYQSISVIEQSTFDQNQTTHDLWISNMKEKQALIEERLALLVNQLESK